MKPAYDDITSRIAEEPQWWDEHGVPRYGAFDPGNVDIYADEVALFLIECQNCAKQFEVALSSPYGSRSADIGVDWETVSYDEQPVSHRVRKGSLHYGDPPNMGCCASGVTMNSVPRRVLQFWRRATVDEMTRFRAENVKPPIWLRVSELEVDVRSPWDDEDVGDSVVECGRCGFVDCACLKVLRDPPIDLGADGEEKK